MNSIINIDEIMTLEGLILLKDYVKYESVLPGKYVCVRKHGLFVEMNGVVYEFDIGIGVSRTPKINYRFYNIPILENDSKETFECPYIIKIRSDKNIFEVKNCNKLILHEYISSLCRSIIGLDAKNRRKQLRTKIKCILSELRG